MNLELGDKAKLVLLDFSGKEAPKELSRYYKLYLKYDDFKSEEYNITIKIQGTDKTYKEFVKELDKFLESQIK